MVPTTLHSLFSTIISLFDILLSKKLHIVHCNTISEPPRGPSFIQFHDSPISCIKSITLPEGCAFLYDWPPCKPYKMLSFIQLHILYNFHHLTSPLKDRLLINFILVYRILSQHKVPLLLNFAIMYHIASQLKYLFYPNL